MKIKDQGITNQSRTNSDPVMLIILILKSMASEILGVEVDNLLVKQHLELLPVVLQKKVLQSLLGKKFSIVGAVTQLGLMSCNLDNWNNNEISKNPFFCPDKKKSVKLWEKYLSAVRKSGSSCGAIIQLRANGVPAGLGSPIYSKLDSDIASGLMSINAVKGVNIGSGMSSAYLSGEENSDEMRSVTKK